MFTIRKNTPVVQKMMKFYNEDDLDGRKGLPGMVRSEAPDSYLSLYEFEDEATKNGLTTDEYLRQWWMEVCEEMTYRWEWNEQVYKGELILKLGRVKFYDLYGQLIIETEGYRSEDIDFEYFQPEIKVQGQWRCPICSFQAFETAEEAEKFIRDRELDGYETKINTYRNGDIEEVSVIDYTGRKIR